ncbi:MAG TPA: radical SAM protein [Spirochaetota bacterium]|nr:radical SAM protein [Spirochaetota bacterium]
MDLLVSELFYSIQGESTRAGFPSVFIRLAGCNLDCAWCDTACARSDGRRMSIERIVKEVTKYPAPDHITITGGEPLCQENAPELMGRLARSYAVQLETNGSIDLGVVPPEIRKIVDVKTPSSGEAGSFLMENLRRVGARDEIKFVIADRKDYTFARKFAKKHLANSAAVVNFSPVRGTIPPAELAGLILADGLRVRLNLQLHAIVWPDGEPKKR